MLKTLNPRTKMTEDTLGHLFFICEKKRNVSTITSQKPMTSHQAAVKSIIEQLHHELNTEQEKMLTGL